MVRINERSKLIRALNCADVKRLNRLILFNVGRYIINLASGFLLTAISGDFSGLAKAELICLIPRVHKYQIIIY